MFNESNYWNIYVVKHHLIVFPQNGSITREVQIIINERISVIQGALVFIITILSQTILFNFCITISIPCFS